MSCRNKRVQRRREEKHICCLLFSALLRKTQPTTVTNGLSHLSPCLQTLLRCVCVFVQSFARSEQQSHVIITSKLINITTAAIIPLHDWPPSTHSLSHKHTHTHSHTLRCEGETEPPPCSINQPPVLNTALHCLNHQTKTYSYWRSNQPPSSVPCLPWPHFSTEATSQAPAEAP